MWTENKTNESPCHRGNTNPLRPSCCTLYDRKTSLDHTGGLSELVFEQHIKIFQGFLPKAPCIIKLPCRTNTLAHEQSLAVLTCCWYSKTLVCLSGSTGSPVNTELFKAGDKCVNTRWSSQHRLHINCKCKRLLLLSPGAHSEIKLWKPKPKCTEKQQEDAVFFKISCKLHEVSASVAGS